LVKTWSADPEPGPDVTAVRDRLDVRWRRDAGLWWGDIGHFGEDSEPYDDYRQWHEMLRRGPLTDASAEADR
jgi:hypothetical protein